MYLFSTFAKIISSEVATIVKNAYECNIYMILTPIRLDLPPSSCLLFKVVYLVPTTVLTTKAYTMNLVTLILSQRQ